MRFLALVLLSSSFSMARAADKMTPRDLLLSKESMPHFETVVQVDSNGSAFCASDMFLGILLRWTFRGVYGPGKAPHPTSFTLECDEPAPEQVRVRFINTADRTQLYELTVKKIPQHDEATAFLIAHRLRENKKIQAAVQDRYIQDSLLAAEAGAEELKKGDWEEAAHDLFRGLENGQDPAVMYYGLASAFAHWSKPVQAYYYYLFYLEESQKSFDEAGKEPLDAMKAHPSAKDVPELQENFRRLNDETVEAGKQKDWDDAIQKARDVLFDNPWDQRFYPILIDGYGKHDLGKFSKLWKRRAKLAQKAVADKKRKAAITAYLSAK